MFTWYSHPLTHVVGRTRVPHVLRWGGVVWARRGVWGSACVPARTHGISKFNFSKENVSKTRCWMRSLHPGVVQTFGEPLTWKRGSSSPGDYWTLILSDPPGQQYWCRSSVCEGGNQISMRYEKVYQYINTYITAITNFCMGALSKCMGESVALSTLTWWYSEIPGGKFDI